jgi:predicted Rossmann-fold nucleotide-binding protein
MMVWQLMQVGFLTERPVVLMGQMWTGLIDWMRQEMASRALVDPADLELVHQANDVDVAVALINEHKKKFDTAREQLILERRRASRAAHAPEPAVTPESEEGDVPR